MTGIHYAHLENGFQERFSSSCFSANILCPHIHHQNVCYSQCKKRALPLKAAVILPSFPAIRALKINDEGSWLRQLFGMRQPDAFGGLSPATDGIHLLKLCTKLQFKLSFPYCMNVSNLLSLILPI